MAEEEGMSGFSLAELAEIDVSDIEEVRFATLPAGGYEFEITEADLGEDEKDGERRFFARFDMKVVGVKVVLEQGVDKDTLIGKNHSERFFVTPSAPEEDVKTAIGRIRAFITDIGQDSTGALGKIVREAKGHTFPGKIIKQKDRLDKSIEYARLKLDPKK